MIAIEKEIIGADPETGKPIIRAFIVSSETPAELPTDGSTVDNLADDEKLGVFSILYVVADSSVYIANEEGEFVLQSSGGGGGDGGGDDEGLVIYAEYDALSDKWTADLDLIQVFEWMDGILDDVTIANPAEYIQTHLTLVADGLTLACDEFSNLNYTMTPPAEYICFFNVEEATALYYYFYDSHGDACTRASADFDGWWIGTDLPLSEGPM